MLVAESPRPNGGEMGEIDVLAVRDSELAVSHVSAEAPPRRDGGHVICHTGTLVPGCELVYSSS